MKTKFAIIPAILLFLASCTHNGGDIGPIFGEWALKYMSIDGTEAADIDCGLYFWRFQGSIVDITVTGPYQESTNHFGRWQMNGNELLLDYTAQSSSPNAEFMPPDNLGIAPGAVTRMYVELLTSKDMTLRNTSEDGRLYVYRFKKLD